MTSPEQILEEAAAAQDPSIVERWWNEGGNMIAFLRIAQERASTDERVQSLMQECGLDAIHPIRVDRSTQAPGCSARPEQAEESDSPDARASSCSP